MAVIEIKNDVLSVGISTLGSELMFINGKNGTEFLWNGDKNVWSYRAPVLFPICGGLKGDTYIYDGKKYVLKKHGFARKSEFGGVCVSDTRAEFILSSSNDKELQRSGTTLNLLWLEYCEQCSASNEVPYQLTQFKKHYRDYAVKANATMHLKHKPGEILRVDWAGQTAEVIDTDTGEVLPAYIFVSSLAYSGYAYVEAFFSMNQECWISAHVNAFKYFGGITKI